MLGPRHEQTGLEKVFDLEIALLVLFKSAYRSMKDSYHVQAKAAAGVVGEACAVAAFADGAESDGDVGLAEGGEVAGCADGGVWSIITLTVGGGGVGGGKRLTAGGVGAADGAAVVTGGARAGRVWVAGRVGSSIVLIGDIGDA